MSELTDIVEEGSGNMALHPERRFNAISTSNRDDADPQAAVMTFPTVSRAAKPFTKVENSQLNKSDFLYQ